MAGYACEGRWRDGTFHLRITRDDRCEELRLAAEDFDCTELETHLAPPPQLAGMAPGDRVSILVLFLTEGALREGTLTYFANETIAVAECSWPARHVRFETAAETFDLWFHAQLEVLLRLVWTDAAVLTADLVAAAGYPELELPEDA
jgi:hypothetical protein